MSWKGCGMEGRPTLASQNGEDRESRQDFATIGIQHFQRYRRDPLTFDVLLKRFRDLGLEHDAGYRHVDLEGAA